MARILIKKPVGFWTCGSVFAKKARARYTRKKFLQASCTTVYFSNMPPCNIFSASLHRKPESIPENLVRHCKNDVTLFCIMTTDCLLLFGREIPWRSVFLCTKVRGYQIMLPCLYFFYFLFNILKNAIAVTPSGAGLEQIHFPRFAIAW